ncbi:MAG TPA: ABC transporter substrate-binding protein, partial [Chloroflexota bacterium]|nr:ABC transporter substrate-binding protein [Chloroflexota bacterium]
MSTEDTVRNLNHRLRTGQMSRRQFIQTLLALGVSGATASALAACAGNPTPAATSAPAAAPAAGQAAASGPKKGGILKRGWQPPTTLDPAFQTNVNEMCAVAQMYDWFVWIDEKNQPAPALATGWESSKDGMTWTFELRKGVTFHNGKNLTTDDVIYTFNRLRDKKVGAGTVELYSNISDIKAPDASHVQFVLAKPNPDLPADLGDYHAAILAADTKDPKTTFNGTGPFILDKFSPEDRATFKRNPNYWMKDMPYLDGIQDIYAPQLNSQVEALRAGEIHMVMGLPAELAETLKKEGKTSLLIGQTNMHMAIRMRSDRGAAKDPKVRQALKLATDRAAILQAARLGYGVVGRDTPVGPGFGDYYLQAPEPKRDVAKAKQLLQEAGVSNLKITLTAQNSFDVPKVATVWKEQLAEAGVTVDIQVVPSDTYYQDSGWLEVDYGITDWGSRATIQPYLQLAYITGAKWNESHWSDPELDQLAAQAASEMDKAKRAELYKKIQQIFIDR